MVGERGIPVDYLKDTLPRTRTDKVKFDRSVRIRLEAQYSQHPSIPNPCNTVKYYKLFFYIARSIAK